MIKEAECKPLSQIRLKNYIKGVPIKCFGFTYDAKTIPKNENIIFVDCIINASIPNRTFNNCVFKNCKINNPERFKLIDCLIYK